MQRRDGWPWCVTCKNPNADIHLGHGELPLQGMQAGEWHGESFCSEKCLIEFISKQTVETFDIPEIEITAAFQMSRNTAKREGFPNTANQVQGYIDQLNSLQAAGYSLKVMAVKEC